MWLKSHQTRVKKAVVERKLVFKDSLMQMFLQTSSLGADLLLSLHLHVRYNFTNLKTCVRIIRFQNSRKKCQYGFL